MRSSSGPSGPDNWSQTFGATHGSNGHLNIFVDNSSQCRPARYNTRMDFDSPSNTSFDQGEDALFESLHSLGVTDRLYAACDHAFHWLRGVRDREDNVNLARLRTHRCMLNDAVIRYSKAAVVGLNGLEFREVAKAECEVLHISQPACELRFKKIDRLGRTSNILTGRQRGIRGSAGQTYFAGMSPPPILTVGYVPDDTLCELVQVRLTVEGGGSYRVAAPPADTIGTIRTRIREIVGEQSA